MVQRGSIKKPLQSLDNMYELGFNSLCSNKRNLVAGNGASTPSGMSGGDGLPASACSGSTTLKPLWIVGRVVPSAMNVAT